MNCIQDSRHVAPKPGHFSRCLSKGPTTTTWVWDLHADAHDFDSHTTDLQKISRKVFTSSAHFAMFLWDGRRTSHISARTLPLTSGCSPVIYSTSTVLQWLPFATVAMPRLACGQYLYLYPTVLYLQVTCV
mmetsp:Transcript_20652/g.24817  ORF Transcript_20652/g.24817 Transcript_20652/m.24817 type:complete len:131 (+) Transcript_20652:2318-2710(+)